VSVESDAAFLVRLSPCRVLERQVLGLHLSSWQGRLAGLISPPEKCVSARREYYTHQWGFMGGMDLHMSS
jgi:hypothetical protein